MCSADVLRLWPWDGVWKRVGPGKPGKGGSWLQTGFILNRGLPQKSSETPRQLPIQGPGSLSQIRKEMERNCLATPATLALCDGFGWEGR